MKFVKSLLNACNGISFCFKNEMNFRIHLLSALGVAIMGFVCHIPIQQWLIVLLCMLIVISLEAVNTAVEKLSNVVCSETHPQIKIVKDVAAAAVLIAAIISATIGIIIFLPKIINILS